MIKCENLQKRVPMAGEELEILKGISLEIKSGETVAVVGASGSGKSTLLGLLAGLDCATAGSVVINDVDLGSLDEDGRASFRARYVGFVFQSFQLLPALTALENVMLPLELQGSSDAGPLARHYLERVELDDRMEHYPLQLSGGEQQRVAVARAFASKPAILFADEPTGNLDTETGQRIIEVLFELNREEGTTLVLVTHDLVLAERCQRRLRLDSGRLVTE
ncbi:ABC transporter ATP-binding protein [Candidatus Marimicrobium litorale]|jgi:putative ABC transport system ATP-binding protein|uniref:ABC transporter ATP-binding protein n=1 Tax=Candidatus Marimicrobium litorale TaxID=2518991 RepID=A0ABT3T2V5_9GAMM|nr:ABC transporter ATP-binding protein [Candidatus Marimicrobium litorale]MCX2976597.1 ABC transporter ATP-binding protein [Candidatus Marimicrobium litorale]